MANFVSGFPMVIIEVYNIRRVREGFERSGWRFLNRLTAIPLDEIRK
jgi:hypothetical protein